MSQFSRLGTRRISAQEDTRRLNESRMKIIAGFTVLETVNNGQETGIYEGFDRTPAVVMRVKLARGSGRVVTWAPENVKKGDAQQK